MSHKQSYMLGVVTCAAVVMFYMEVFYNPPMIEKNNYVEVNVPSNKPDFQLEAKKVLHFKWKSALNPSKLTHLMIYIWGLCGEYSVPYDIVKAVIETESSWDHKAVSTSGAIGLMQVLPTTSMSEFNTPGSALYDPYVNVTVGIKYLSKLKDRFDDWNKVLTAYSHGPTITDTYSDNYVNNNFYVKRVLASVK